MTNKTFGMILGEMVLLLIMMIYAIKYETIISLFGPVNGVCVYIVIGVFLGIIGIVLALSETEEDC